ncbi:MAG: hypothetical protein A2312_02670 [Candidatus Staskawiczbacteria bacterium RIFOXYB2_FULL_32_9]|nr:MAG: hypothetical protein UR22_C0006G0009 [Parcubacteria group bacterium GW2011_GWC2_32_10]OGZ80415.1 MAG: hypothetical protein A2256_02930 [Candidatus Staskawiczbacteria bacterium RIFOXYA2_FULL_32_7]OGZ80879.1 MAG: hypothetical protein A2360_04285 [Candidatus Staskawiczbacteria bacterium RIFOXYB1_FULL_32_11]OGZ84270.1 MAG: hypothetical protein A2312_02670 [Candidatus Staskawiczbacteria bacterium RIFOXYB2_FULL_32_9]OGZ85867.1 MAG: hypothetical protein A2463_03235 [Candidatus Staskawiczbacter
MNDHGTALIGQWTELVAELFRQLPRADDPRLPAILAKYSNGQGGFQGALLKKDLDEALLLPKKEPKLLRRVGMANVTAVAKFVVNEVALKAANVGYTGSNFDSLFRGKVEENVPAGVVGLNLLERNSKDSPIMAELGDKAVSPVVYLFDSIRQTNEAMARGEDGPLLTDGYKANVLYAIGSDGNIWAVSACWCFDDRCWSVLAFSVVSPYDWDAGVQILSRDS